MKTRTPEDVTSSGQTENGMNSLSSHEHKRYSNDAYYSRLVSKAAYYYDEMSELRKKWNRANDYFMGRQLNDKVTYDGREMTVEKYLQMRGLPAFQNDIISDKVMTLKGLLRQESMAATCKATDSNEEQYAAIFSEFLRKNDNLNERKELNADMFQKACIYAFLCAKVSYTWREGKEDVYIDQPDIYRLALPPFEKGDLSDVDFIAEAHDMTWGEILETFCEGKQDEEELSQIYSLQTERENARRGTGFKNSDTGGDFRHPIIFGKYRVIEIWKKERNRSLWCHDRASGEAGYRPMSDKAAIDAENRSRIDYNIRRDETGNVLTDETGNTLCYIDPSQVQLIEYKEKIEQFWYYRFLTPDGHLLREGVSPYRVQRDGYSFRFHPYVFMAYPCLHGETRSFVDRGIDKQRATNHYMIMFDSIMGNAAKGAVAIDDQSLSPLMTREEIMHQYSKPNGVVIYSTKNGGEMPKAIQNVHIPAGLEWMVQKNEALLTQQSGVQGALQGVHKSTSGRQYQIEREAAGTTVSDYFGAFYSFSMRLSKKQLWEIQQFYDSNRSVKIAGDDFSRYYNKATMGDINVDLSLDMDAYSAVVREANNDMLWQLMLQNRIDLPTMLDCGSFNNATLLKKRWAEFEQRQIAAQQASAAQGGTQGVPGAPQQPTLVINNGDNKIATQERSLAGGAEA